MPGEMRAPLQRAHLTKSEAEASLVARTEPMGPGGADRPKDSKPAVSSGGGMMGP